MNRVIFTVDGVDNRALVIVYPFAIKSRRRRKVISLPPVMLLCIIEYILVIQHSCFENLPVNIPPSIVKGPIPETAYLAHVTLFSKMPIH